MADEALVSTSVPRKCRGFVLLRTLPADQVLGEETAGVLAANQSVNLVLVQERGFWTSTTLQVVRQAGRGCVILLTEWAR